MKKKGAFIAVMLAGIMSFGVATATGCKKHGSDNKHTHNYQWVNNNDGTHSEKCKNVGCDAPVKSGPLNHDYSSPTDTTCDKCGNVRTVGGAEHTHNFKWIDNGDGTHTERCQNSGCDAPLGNGPEGHVNDAGSDNKCDKCGATVTGGGGEEDPEPTPAVTYKVTFMDGGVEVSNETVESGKTVSAPSLTKSGHYLKGWYESAAGTGSAFDFTTAITGAKTLHAVWAAVDARLTYNSANKESASFEWGEGDIANAKVEYKLSSESAYKQADSQLIRIKEPGTARADVVGLKGGEKYDFKITPSSGNEITLTEMSISAYDRSGYAHFKYTDGVGAYNDDGTLKDNALVIYVTDDNKNSVSKGYVNGQEVDLTEYLWQGRAGIGWILNNRGYDSNTSRENYGIQKLCFTYGAVDIRILGTVNAEAGTAEADAPKSLIDGLTVYNSTENGGSVGDNGRMARITNAKNLTIEGIGEDASMRGWGVHFVSNDNLHKYEGSGKSFEVRNLTFESYPEDAIGMEGVQASGINADGSSQSKSSKNTDTLYSPVERCWVHNNTFLPGFCADPAESDKAEGDGSCDFKRGMYFTCSYNYFADCHKTNLVGANGDTLQFNLSYHHNHWYNCKARQPLARNANIHYYNNFIQYTTDTVMSIRADAYLFAEANYFEGCKNPTEYNKEGSSTIKLYNNTFYACYEFKGGVATPVTQRDEYVTNTCKYIAGNIDYSHFDTNPEQFYYDATNKVTDCYITDSVTARAQVIKYAGVQKRDYSAVNTEFVQNKPSKALTIPKEGLTVDLSAVPENGGEVNGVLFSNIESASSGKVKGIKQFVTFTLSGRTEVSLTSESEDPNQYAEFLRADGTLIAGKVSTYKGTLEAGTYVISGGQIDATGKNTRGATLTSLSFKPGESDEEVAQKVIALINAIPSPVTESSGAAITAAREAYDSLSAEQKALVTNVKDLTDAEAEFANVAVNSINQKITALAATSTATDETSMRALLADYREVETLYNAIPTDKRGQVNGYSKVTDGIAALTDGLKPYDVKAQIAALPAKADVTSSDRAAVTAARTAYDALTSDQKTTVGDITKLTEAEAVLAELAAQTVIIGFTSGLDDYYDNADNKGIITIVGNLADVNVTGNNEVTYTKGLKIESSTRLTIAKSDTARKIVLHLGGTPSGSLKDVNNENNVYDVVGTTVTITLAANTDLTLTKKDGTKNIVAYIEISPAD